ncbi:tripartite tricarboxylate transporter permease [Pseudomonas lopnurensis]|uniref:tripartite tricarboxylate transporter permease n=1 Tax=Pseudomonas lopnurensis TaxID=1477517 RepID=UPI0028B0DDBE|nr:tripartite tricarboxylate transporter permease [Pseudomonas lopnurensis]
MEILAVIITILTTTPAIFAAIGGVAWGVVGGALPGISPSIAMALLLPFTYGMDPTVAIILLAATYVGAEYGGSIPAILINTPGTNAAAATVLDGYAMRQKGLGGQALGISLACGVFGSLIGLALLVGLAEPLANFALLFTPAAYFALGILGISVIVSLSEGSLVKGLITACFGLMIATVGSDPFSGVSRFTFGKPELLEGVPYILIMIGIYALSELFTQAGDTKLNESTGIDSNDGVGIKLPGLKMMKRIFPSSLIGAGFGSFEGMMPGAGGTIASFMSYNEARRWSKRSKEFGTGVPEGIAAPETANNAVACTSLIPTLSFGIPGSNSTAILLGGLMLHGMIPGPLLFQQHPETIYGLYGGLFIASLSLLVIGVMIMKPCLWLVGQPRPLLSAGIYALVLSGVYSINNEAFDIGMAFAAAVLGYGLKYFKFPFLPLVLGTILGYLLESNYRRALLLSNGDHMIFIHDPISIAMLSLAAIFIITSLVKNAYSSKKSLLAPQ